MTTTLDHFQHIPTHNTSPPYHQQTARDDISNETKENEILYTHSTTLRGHKKAISSVKYSPNGSWLASSSNDRTVRIWDAETNNFISTLLGHELGISDVSWSPDSQMVTTASDDTNVNLWDCHNKRIIKSFKGHTNYVMCANFNPRGNLIASGSFDSTARIWDVDRGVCLHRFDAHDDVVVSAHFSGDGSKLVTAGFDGYVKVWDVTTGNLVRNFVINESAKTPVCFAKWSPNMKYILVGCFDSSWKLLEAKTGKPSRTYYGHKFNDYCIFASFSLNRGKCIISGSADNTVCIWDINTKALLQKLEGHTDVVVAVEAHPTCDIIASGALDADKTVRIWRPPVVEVPSSQEEPEVEIEPDADHTAREPDTDETSYEKPDTPQHIDDTPYENFEHIFFDEQEHSDIYDYGESEYEPI